MVVTLRFPIEDWNWTNYFSVNHVRAHVPTPYELCSFFPGEMQMPHFGWKRQNINGLRLLSFGIFSDEILSSSSQSETWFWSIHFRNVPESHPSTFPNWVPKSVPRMHSWNAFLNCVPKTRSWIVFLKWIPELRSQNMLLNWVPNMRSLVWLPTASGLIGVDVISWKTWKSRANIHPKAIPS